MKLPTVLHLDIDAFFAAVEVLIDPTLKGKPVIVGGLAHERGVVCTASYEARKFGVHSGMALRTAAKKCPRGIFLRGRYHLYSRISRKLFDCLRRFSPTVDEVSVDEAYVDLSGSRYLCPSVYDLAWTIKREAERETGLSLSAGLGRSRLGAKLATAAAKPRGFCWLTDEEEFIANLAVEKVPGIGPQTAFVLRGLGIRRVRELKERYFSLWKRIFGFREGPAGPAAAKSFSRETTFPADIRDPQLILSHLAYLVDRLSIHLLEEGLYAGRIEVKVRFSDFVTCGRRRALSFPTYSYFEIWQTARPLVLELMARKALPLRLVGIKVEELQARRDLLPFVPLRGERLVSGVGRVKSRFGFSSIFTARELFLQSLYPVEREGIVLKTASLTK